MTCTLPTVRMTRPRACICSRARVRPTYLYVARDETRKTGPAKWRSTDSFLSGHSFDYHCQSALFPHLAYTGLSRRSIRTSCLYKRTHARTSAPVLVARAAESRQCQCMHTYVSYIWTERNEFRCARRGQRRLALLTMTKRAGFLMFYFLGVSRIVPRIRYCRWLSGIMKRLLTPVSMSRDFRFMLL